MKYKIACIVVTYNRKKLLLNCLKSICLQSYKPTTVFIIDNASTDNTKDLLLQESFLNNELYGIYFRYIRLNENIGGAGGFYEGMKTAYEENCYDAYWVMDDDGIPDKDCLYNLQQYLDKYSYISPLVLDIENPLNLSFPYKSEKTFMDVINKYGENGIIINRSNPFNGILYKNNLLKTIGFPKKDMFIWGDECEYDERAKFNGFPPITVIKALHKHPKDRMKFHKDIIGREIIIFTDSKLRNYCKYRNTAYLLKKYKSKSSFIKFVLQYILFFCVQRRFDLKNLKLFLNAIHESLSDHEFNGHYKFINKP